MAFTADETIKLTALQINIIRDKFNMFDVNRDGHLPSYMLREVMRTLGYSLTDKQLLDLVDTVDVDGNGTIEWEEFLPLVATYLKEKENTEFYRSMFRVLDKKKLGYIKCEDLRFVLSGLSEQLDISEQDIDHIVKHIDEDGNGQVYFDEFYKLMTTD